MPVVCCQYELIEGETGNGNVLMKVKEIKIFFQKISNFFDRTSDQTNFPVAFRLEKTPSEGGYTQVKYFFNYNDTSICFSL